MNTTNANLFSDTVSPVEVGADEALYIVDSIWDVLPSCLDPNAMPPASTIDLLGDVYEGLTAVSFALSKLKLQVEVERKMRLDGKYAVMRLVPGN